MTNADGSGNQAPVKLRASCNACNESKVRCSQTKPTCDQCKRKGMPCVFGLSRRSHKDAPRIVSSSRFAPPSPSGTGAMAAKRPRIEAAAHVDDSVYSTVAALCAFHDFNVFSQNPATATAAAPNSGRIPRSADLLAGFRDCHGDSDEAALWPFNQLDPMDFLSTSDGGGLEPPLNPASLDAGTWGGAHDAVSPHPLSPQPLVPRLHLPSQSRPNQQPQQQQQYEQTQPQPHDQHGRNHAQDSGSSPEGGACTCSSRVIPDLARKPQAARSQGAGRPLSFDVELSQLKQAILACEASMACQLHSSSHTVTMIIGFLIGDIVDSFKTLLSGSSPSSSSSYSATTTDSGSNPGRPTTSNNNYNNNNNNKNNNNNNNNKSSSSSSGNNSKNNNAGSPTSSTWGATLSEGVTMVSPGTGVRRESSMAGEPRLSWGVLQLEDDDEAELRSRLCLLYFRRVRGLLKHFDQAVRQFREAQVAAGSCTATFIMACDYVRMWLEQKVEAVKKLFNNTDREASI
ncbi:hypothetical protein BDP81DRAFT_451136 [Colletotrichum phormii]|uniref:Zn(2)-C6 fungal-type domain-containing protein n=1 Tax=Colletotrichum phormii TaxID=359342 RepID=A0AAI9ZM89_9PEZI|nr:uncharacterized protein BDP81DRAFT_451136 [Colletotrichum phormii]KAK1634587.1 hypothetical protein BDP81DRAFT_451136 [Colletotrichum phormii]